MCVCADIGVQCYVRCFKRVYKKKVKKTKYFFVKKMLKNKITQNNNVKVIKQL